MAALVCALSVTGVPAGAPPRERAVSPAAVFYYGWWGTPGRDGGYRHWQQNGHEPPADLASSFYPRRGAYSSTDTRVLADQMTEIRHAGIAEVIVSWWGRGSFEDRGLRAIARAAGRAGLVTAVHLEPYPGRSAETVADDLRYLAGRGVRDVYVYEAGDLPATAWAAVPRPAGMRLFAQTGRVGLAAAGRFDGVYTYDLLALGGRTFKRLCGEARAAGLLCLPSVGPGYRAVRATRDARVKPREAGRTYDAMWLAALRAGADGVTVTSYNEWHEGTQIEPAERRAGYADYRGAYGLRGARAECAYIWRTAEWTRAWAEGRSVYGRPLSARTAGEHVC
jgi:glycoprotein endo-alpha-1,2-mannosidase